MVLLLDAEREALLDIVCRFDQLLFEPVLVRAGAPPISAFSSMQRPMAAIAVDFYGWLSRNEEKAPRLLHALAGEAGASDEALVLTAAASRLLARDAKVRASGPPTRAHLAGGVPIVDRSVLRGHLQAAIDYAGDPMLDVKFVKVVGERGLGRSHSWYLIKYVADAGAGKAIKFDLASAALADQTLDILFRELKRAFKLTDAEQPTAVGVTADTLAARHAEEIARSFGVVCSEWPKPLWLVFDSLDRELRPEIKRFVSLLVQARLDGTFDRCVIFLLGPDPVTEPADPWQLGRTEELVAFNDGEIRDAALSLHGLGVAPLPAAELEERIKEMQRLRRKFRAGELCRQVATHLMELRVAVRA